MLATQLAFDAMRGDGAIVNVSSVAGLGHDSVRRPDYAAAKAAVVRFTSALANHEGVRVNCVCPDWVDTPAVRRSLAEMTEEERADVPPLVPADEIAEIVARPDRDDSAAGRVVARYARRAGAAVDDPTSVRSPHDATARAVPGVVLVARSGGDVGHGCALPQAARRVDLGGDDRVRRARDPRADHAAAARARDARAVRGRDALRARGIAVGAGASAIATILFTQAFVQGDPITPVVLQKVQPLIAIAAARVILGEEPRRRFPGS